MLVATNLENPLVSIIITSYNRRDLLERAVKSCINQRYQNIEVVVVDDRSEFNAFSIKSTIKDRRIKIFINSRNRGLCYSRNFGFSKSKGQYICFLDDDDFLHEDKLFKQITLFKASSQGNLGIVLSDVAYLDKNGKRVVVKTNHFSGFLGRSLCLRSSIWGTCNPLFTRELINEFRFDYNLPTHEEYDLFLRCSQKYNFDYVPEVLNFVDTSKSLLSKDFKRRLKGTKILFKKHADLFKGYGYWVFAFNQLRFCFLYTIYLISYFLGYWVYRVTLEQRKF